eukprot:358937-Chlamydomonas_euryale.AAC.20
MDTLPRLRSWPHNTAIAALQVGFYHKKYPAGQKPVCMPAYTCALDNPRAEACCFAELRTSIRSLNASLTSGELH